MGFSDQHIRIDQKRVRITDTVSQEDYDQSVALTGSLSEFLPLPSNVRRYERKPSGQEFWIIESDTGQLTQQTPDPSYSAMVTTLGDNLTGLIAAMIAATTPVFETTLQESNQLTTGVELVFDITTNYPLPVDVTLVFDNSSDDPIVDTFQINTSPYSYGVMLLTEGVFLVTINAIELGYLEVTSL